VRRIAKTVNFGEFITLDDESEWQVATSDLEISFSWDQGDLIEAKPSERMDYPILLINRTNQSFALAAPGEAPVQSERKQATEQTQVEKAISPSVESVSNNGRYLRLSNSSTYLIAPIDRGRVDRWLPQHRVRVDDSREGSSQFSVRLENINRQETVRGRKTG
jgi:hypothetical protein